MLFVSGLSWLSCAALCTFAYNKVGLQVSSTDGALVVNGKRIAVYAVMKADEIPWRSVTPKRTAVLLLHADTCSISQDLGQGSWCGVHLRVDGRVH